MVAKRSISACETVLFGLRNGPFCVLKRTVLQRQTASIGNPLEINTIQRRLKGYFVMNYFYILLSSFSYLYVVLQHNFSIMLPMIFRLNTNFSSPDYHFIVVLGA